MVENVGLERNGQGAGVQALAVLVATTDNISAPDPRYGSSRANILCLKLDPTTILERM